MYSTYNCFHLFHKITVHEKSGKEVTGSASRQTAAGDGFLKEVPKRTAAKQWKHPNESH